MFRSRSTGIRNRAHRQNTDQYASNAHIDIEIRGTGDKTTAFTLMFITSPNNVVRGLSLYNALKKIQLQRTQRVQQHAFRADSSAPTRPAPTSGRPASCPVNGIEVIYGVHDNIIGGPALADRNVLSGNAGHGIAFYSAGSDHNVVTNSIGGSRRTGRARSQPRAGHRHQPRHRVHAHGGFGPNDHNVVSGNGQGGIEVSHSPGTQDNQILGNWVGTTVDGNSTAPYTANPQTGIMVQDGSSLTLVQGNWSGTTATRVSPSRPTASAARRTTTPSSGT